MRLPLVICQKHPSNLHIQVTLISLSLPVTVPLSQQVFVTKSSVVASKANLPYVEVLLKTTLSYVAPIVVIA